MQAWIDFFTTDYGLMSLAVIAFILFMGAYIGWFVNMHVKEDTARRTNTAPHAPSSIAPRANTLR